FFQAEDGIRDFHVTGVQTCALPILYWSTIPSHLEVVEYSMKTCCPYHGEMQKPMACPIRIPKTRIILKPIIVGRGRMNILWRNHSFVRELPGLAYTSVKIA